MIWANYLGNQNVKALFTARRRVGEVAPGQNIVKQLMQRWRWPGGWDPVGRRASMKTSAGTGAPFRRVDEYMCIAIQKIFTRLI